MPVLLWLVVCCINFMNRLLEGHGIHGDPALFQSRGNMLHQHGYLPPTRALQHQRTESAA